MEANYIFDIRLEAYGEATDAGFKELYEKLEELLNGFNNTVSIRSMEYAGEHGDGCECTSCAYGVCHDWGI